MSQRILFFESDAEFATAVRRALHERGVAVESYDEVQDGLQRALEAPPNLILLTVELRNENGFRLCTRLKKKRETAGVPVIILSSDSPPETFEQHRKLRVRAEDYIRKPISAMALVERVSNFIPLAPAPEASAIEMLDSIEAVEVPIEEIELDGSQSVEIDEEISAFADLAFDKLMAPATEPRDSVSVDVSVAESSEVDEVTMVPPGIPPDADPNETLDLDELVPEEEMSSGPLEATGTYEQSVLVNPLEAMLEDDSIHPDRIREARELREQVAELERQLQVSKREASARREELAAAQNEMASLKQKSRGHSGATSREFLELRESLNSKDRELLDLRDNVVSRDKRLQRLSEKLAEVETRAAGTLGELEASSANVSALETQVRVGKDDAELAAKRTEDLRIRLERAEEKVKASEAAFASLRQEHASFVSSADEARSQADAQRKAADDAIHGAQQLEEELRAKVAEQQHALQQALEESNRSLAESDAALRETRREAEKLREALEDANRMQAREREEIAQEHEDALAGLRKIHQAEVEGLSETHEAAVASLRTDMTAEHESAINAVREELVKRSETELSSQMASQAEAHEAALKTLREEIQVAQERELEERVAKHAQELNLLGRRLAQMEDAAKEADEAGTALREKLQGTEGRLSALLDERSVLEARCQELQTELEGVNGRLTEITDQFQAATDRGVELSDALGEAQNKCRDLETSLDEAREVAQRLFPFEAEVEQLRARSAILEAKQQKASDAISRSRRALSIGLALLDEAESDSDDGVSEVPTAQHEAVGEEIPEDVAADDELP